MNVLLFKDPDYYFIIPERRLISYNYEDFTELLNDRGGLKESLEHKYDVYYFMTVSEIEMHELKDKHISKIPYEVFFGEELEKEFPELFI